MLQYGLTFGQPLHQPTEVVSEVADRLDAGKRVRVITTTYTGST
ncbi:hypothetical protein OAC41_03875 [Acidimicrobiales bacterium]|jgi:hypothetical protein|nr:hypothetical protein [Acidimicrobiales bacterium]